MFFKRVEFAVFCDACVHFRKKITIAKLIAREKFDKPTHFDETRIHHINTYTINHNVFLLVNCLKNRRLTHLRIIKNKNNRVRRITQALLISGHKPVRDKTLKVYKNISIF